MIPEKDEEILGYLNWYTQELGLEPPSVSAARLGLQMLEVAICRILDGNPIDDFLQGPGVHHIPSQVRDLYQAYVEGTTQVTAIITGLRAFNERYVSACVRLGLPEEFVRATGVREIRCEQGHPEP